MRRDLSISLRRRSSRIAELSTYGTWDCNGIGDSTHVYYTPDERPTYRRYVDAGILPDIIIQESWGTASVVYDANPIGEITTYILEAH